MKTSFFVLALSLALAASAAPQNSQHEVRQFGGFGNKGGFFGNGFGNNGNGRNNGNGGNNNNNNNSKGGQGNQGGNAGNNNQNAGGAAGANNGTATGNNNGDNAGAANNGTATGNNNGAGAGDANNSTNTGNDGQDPQKSLTLDPGVIAKGFANDGQDVPAAGQVASLTSTNNFINFCLTVPNLKITNGQQITAGSCNPAPMGVIPSTDNMPSSKFVFPKNGATIKENTQFTIQMAIRGMQAGFFVNADENYFAAPQFLNGQGQIQGHSHVVVETLDAVDQTAPTDPKKFAFFKGLNAPADNGQLTADVTNGLPAGVYKLSSINTAANHQPVLVPIAQHGSLDDAVYFTVTADGQPDANSGALNGNSTAGAGNAGAGNAGAGNTGAGNTGAGNAGAGNTGSGKGNTGANQNANGGKNNQNQNQNTDTGKNNQNNQQNNNNNGGRGFGGRNRRFVRPRL